MTTDYLLGVSKNESVCIRNYGDTVNVRNNHKITSLKIYHYIDDNISRNDCLM